MRSLRETMAADILIRYDRLEGDGRYALLFAFDYTKDKLELESGDFTVWRDEEKVAVAQQLFDAPVDGNGRHSWRRADGFLRAAEADINALAIDFHRQADERCHAIRNQQSPEFVRNFAERSDRGQNAG